MEGDKSTQSTRSAASTSPASASKSTLSNALTLGRWTLVSRVTGLARDMLLAQTLGARWVYDAFLYAFQLPNLMRRLFGEGALAAAFVPALTRAREQHGQARSVALFHGILSLTVIALLATVMLIELVAAVVWWLTPESSTGGVGREARMLVVQLTALLAPFTLGICVVALLSSVLNVFGRFAPGAIAPVVLNLWMIAGLLIARSSLPNLPEQQAFAVAGSVLLASVCQVGLLLVALRQIGISLRWRWTPREPEVGQTLRRVVPVVAGQGLLTFGVFIDAQLCLLLTRVEGGAAEADWLGLRFSYPLEEGALTVLTIAARLYQFPMGVLAVSLGTALLPALSRLAAREDWRAWQTELGRTLNLAIFVALPASAAMIAIPHELVALLFEYRAFESDDTARAARVLQVYGLALPAFFLQHMFARAYFSHSDVLTPLRINLAIMPMSLLVTLTLVWQSEIGEAAFAYGSLVAAWIGVGIYIGLLRKQLHGSGWRALGRLAGMLLATGMMIALLTWVGPWLTARLIDLPLGIVLQRLIGVGVLLALGLGSYTLVAWMLSLGEIRMFVARVRERLGRRRTDAS